MQDARALPARIRRIVPVDFTPEIAIEVHMPLIADKNANRPGIHFSRRTTVIRPGRQIPASWVQAASARRHFFASPVCRAWCALHSGDNWASWFFMHSAMRPSPGRTSLHRRSMSFMQG